MPPQITVTENQILDAAFELVRSRGIEQLSARNVAQALDCSPQPIYRAFGSMDGLRRAVHERAVGVAMSYLMGEDAEHPFLGMGLGNLRLAQQEPHLHRLLTRSDAVVLGLMSGEAPPPIVLEQMRGIPQLADLDQASLGRIHTLLWFFSQGLATIFDTHPDEDLMPMAQEYLTLAGRAVIAWEGREENE